MGFDFAVLDDFNLRVSVAQHVQKISSLLRGNIFAIDILGPVVIFRFHLLFVSQFDVIYLGTVMIFAEC